MDKLGVKIIRGRAYHPQTQGSVEVANRIFKARLQAVAGESGEKEWVKHLPQLAEVINTTRPSCLPAHVTPYEVFFGRKPWWLLPEEFPVELPVNEVVPEEVNSEDESYLLTELSKRVRVNNLREQEKMQKKGGPALAYVLNQTVLLAIPPKNRLSAKATRLPCRIQEVRTTGYILLSQFGQLKGLHQGSELRGVFNGVTFNIPPWVPGSKLLTIAAAATAQAGRKPIAAQQKEGRAATAAKRKRAAAALEEEDNDDNRSEQLRQEALAAEAAEAEEVAEGSSPLVAKKRRGEKPIAKKVALVGGQRIWSMRKRN
jgi:hypothetical protein